jgi:hypothetical protein
MVAFATHDDPSPVGNGITVAADAGGTWTKAEGADHGDFYSALFWKVTTGSEPANYTFDWDSGNDDFTVKVVPYDPGSDTVDTGSIQTTSNVATDTTITSDSITAVAGDLFFVGFANDSSATVSGAPTGTIIGTLQDPGALSASCYDQENVGAGAITDSITWSVSDNLSALALTCGVTSSGSAVPGIVRRRITARR